MICYRDMAFCSRSAECGNVTCERHRAKIDEEERERMGLPIAWMDMKAEGCGFAGRCQACGSILGDDCRCHQEELP